MPVIQMLLHITGGRADGTQWPHPGGLLEVDDREAADLFKAGLAQWPPERAVSHAEPSAAADEGDGTPDGDGGSQPAVRHPKQAWVEHAIAQGADAAVAESMTKADLIARYGSPA